MTDYTNCNVTAYIVYMKKNTGNIINTQNIRYMHCDNNAYTVLQVLTRTMCPQFNYL